MRRAAAIAAAVVIALSACSACSAGSTATPTDSRPTSTAASVVDDRCADVVVLGLRGQGQSTRAHDGVGAEVQSSFRALVERLRGGERVRLEAVRYPAGLAATSAGFDHDVAAGRRMLVARLAALASACPRSRYVVIGFSEGADVVHRAVSAMSAEQVADIAAVAVLGDPLRDPDDTVPTETFGGHGLDGRGSLAPGPRWGAAVRRHVISFCTPKDNVCNAPLAGRGGAPISSAHREFYEQDSSARVTADRIARTIEPSA